MKPQSWHKVFNPPFWSIISDSELNTNKHKELLKKHFFLPETQNKKERKEKPFSYCRAEVSEIKEKKHVVKNHTEMKEFPWNDWKNTRYDQLLAISVLVIKTLFSSLFIPIMKFLLN